MASADIVMPFLNETMEEGTVGHWLKKVGDQVALGEELVEIETDKASMVYEADESGTITEICVQEGETVPVGTVIAKLDQTT
jgi:pyruvate dehydrogenase E2 component (dihydrolipoamide acetyltransferase)